MAGEMNILYRLITSVLAISAFFYNECFSSGFLSGLAKTAKSTLQSTVDSQKKQVTDGIASAKQKADGIVSSVKQKTTETVDKTMKQVSDSTSAVSKSIEKANEQTENPDIATTENTLKAIDEDIDENKSPSDSTNSLPKNAVDKTAAGSSSKKASADTTSIEQDTKEKTFLHEAKEQLDNEKTILFSQETIEKIDPIFASSTTSIINAKGTEMNDEDIPYFSQKLSEFAEKGNSGITLVLADNKLTTEGIGIMLTTIKKFPKLISILDLSGNNLGDDIAFMLYGKSQETGQCENYIPTATAVLLARTNLSGGGILHILRSISEQRNTIMQMLDFSKNEVNEPDILEIIELDNEIPIGSLNDGILLTSSQSRISDSTSIPNRLILNK